VTLAAGQRLGKNFISNHLRIVPASNLTSVISTFTVEDLIFLRYQYRVAKDWNNDPRLAVVPGVNLGVIGAKVTSGIRFVDGSDQLRYQVGGAPLRLWRPSRYPPQIQSSWRGPQAPCSAA
jgi:hypothetical protein